ncbi:glutathione reductase [Anopheles sinensis]|uniref:Glutathione reductase n=1 Tax=Anopheles sinensis TaxID=74873 RepID=A0A084WQD0_ANOSI|nr:glutathione reductase [Anopheles sinensis]
MREFRLIARICYDRVANSSEVFNPPPRAKRFTFARICIRSHAARRDGGIRRSGVEKRDPGVASVDPIRLTNVPGILANRTGGRTVEVTPLAIAQLRCLKRKTLPPGTKNVEKNSWPFSKRGKGVARGGVRSRNTRLSIDAEGVG